MERLTMTPERAIWMIRWCARRLAAEPLANLMGVLFWELVWTEPAVRALSSEERLKVALALGVPTDDLFAAEEARHD